MKERIRWADHFSAAADLPGEDPPGQPIIEVAGDKRVLIEHHKGVVAYGCEKICVKVKFGIVSILGHGLELTRMTRQQLVISGRIESVLLCRRE